MQLSALRGIDVWFRGLDFGFCSPGCSALRMFVAPPRAEYLEQPEPGVFGLRLSQSGFRVSGPLSSLRMAPFFASLKPKPPVGLHLPEHQVDGGPLPIKAEGARCLEGPLGLRAPELN